MKNLKGGYKIVSLQNNDLSSGFTLEGIYEAIASSYGKPILVTDIVISGEKKNDVFTTVQLSSDDYTFTIYGKTLTIDDDDSVTIASGELGIYRHEISSSNVSGKTLVIISTQKEAYTITYSSGTIKIDDVEWAYFVKKVITMNIMAYGTYHGYVAGNGGNNFVDSYADGSPLALTLNSMSFWGNYTYTDTVTKL